MRQFFIVVTHRGCEFMACLAFYDTVFCQQLFNLFLQQRGRTIKDIGGLDLSFTL